MVLDGFFPFDIRVEKESSALLKAGYEVVVICYRNEGQKEVERKDGLEIIRTSAVITTKRKGIADIIRSVFGRNVILYSLVKKHASRAVALHAHDLPVFKTAWIVAKKNNIPVVLDLHENFPEGILTWFSWRKEKWIQIKNRIFFDYNAWLKKEHFAVHQADKVIAVVEEMRDRVVRVHGVEPEKVVIVSNTEPKDLYDQRELPTRGNPSKDIVYVGSIGPHRGLDTAIKAMPSILSSDSEVRLVVVGSGNLDTINYLKNLTLDLGVEDSVVFTGQVPYNEALRWMVGAFLNIIPHHSNGQNESTIPHKLFQIFLSGYPLLVSSCAPFQRIVGGNAAGLVFRAGDEDDFADKVKWALHNPDAVKQMVEMGRKLVLENGYDWASDAHRLVNLYDELLS